MKMKNSIKHGMSILIPTYNNLECLKTCIMSIVKNSMVTHEILIHVSDGSDGTLKWVREHNIKHTHSKENVGVSVAMNRAKELSSTDLLMYLNDDMYVLPGWDSEIFNYIEISNCYIQTWITGTMIEFSGNNEVSIIANYGKSPWVFDERRLLNDYNMLKTMMPNHKNTVCPPTLIHRIVWEMIKGYDEDIFAAGSDAFLAKRVFDVGCDFVQVGKSLVYHFMSKTVSRIKDPRNQKKLFKEKFGITIEEFYSKQLVRKKA